MTSSVKVIGHAVEARYRFFRHFGDEAHARFVAQLSPDAQSLFREMPRASSWYPIEHLVEGLRVADEVFGTGDLSICAKAGRYAADRNLTGTFRSLFFRFGNPSFGLSRAAAAWRVHYDAGRVSVAESSRAHAVLHWEGIPEVGMQPALFEGIQGWLLRAIELFGSHVDEHELQLDQPEPGQAIFRASWT